MLKEALIENLTFRLKYYDLKIKTTKGSWMEYYRGKKACVEELLRDIQIYNGEHIGMGENAYYYKAIKEMEDIL